MRPTPDSTFCSWQFIIRSNFILFCILFSSFCADSVGADRTLTFPTDWEHATVSVYATPQPSDFFSDCVEFGNSGRMIGVAAGEVQVPDDAFVGIEVQAVEGFENFLGQLPNTGIHRIELTKAALSDSVFRSIERIETLREMRLVDCSCQNVAIRSLVGAQQLQYLFAQGKKNQSLHQTLAAWAAKCKQLQYFYDGHSLAADEIHRFESHHSPLCISVEFGAEALEVFNALCKVPNMVALNVTVLKEVPDHYHEALAKLQRIEFLNWGGGDLDSGFLNSLSKIGRLRAIRVQGSAKVADGFIEGLPSLKNLEAITFSFQLSQYQKSILPKLLLSMEKLREIPPLDSASPDQLEALSSRSKIRSLVISGLGNGASEEQLSKVILANPQLRDLTLADVVLTPALAAAICQAENLRRLNLTVKEFDGKWLKSPEQLRRLESLILTVRGYSINLDTLSHIPNLGLIDASVDTHDPAKWSFIAGAKALKDFRISEGFCDDSIVAFLQQNKNVRRFSTNQICMLTDSGVSELCKCSHLEAIDISGAICEASIEKLGQMPNLERLSVGTTLIDEESKKRLQEKLSRIRSFRLSETPRSLIGKDGLQRMVPDQGRSAFDALEGTSLESLLRPAWTDELRSQLRSKVVVVEFWGTWCGPCLRFVPELERLQSRFGIQGLQIVSIHSKNGSENAADYVAKHPKLWPSLIDFDGELEKKFDVPIWPSVYLFGRDGKMKIALPHRWSLQNPLAKLLDEAP